MTEHTFPMFACERHRMGVDGKGVTTLVTALGCPLRCRMCLNPQSWDGRAKALHVTPRELYDRVRCDELYFLATGGGVTFGGGEPLSHAAFISAFRSVCGELWHICAETSLNVPREQVVIASECVDEFIVDVKDTDPVIYRSYTGMDNENMLANLRWLVDTVGGERIVARVPLIPGYNSTESIEKSVTLLNGMGIHRIDRFKYIEVHK